MSDDAGSSRGTGAPDLAGRGGRARGPRAAAEGSMLALSCHSRAIVEQDFGERMNAVIVSGVAPVRRCRYARESRGDTRPDRDERSIRGGASGSGRPGVYGAEDASVRL